MPPTPLRIAYISGSTASMGYLLIQAEAIAKAAVDARRAARAADDPDAADALNAAATAMDGAAYVVWSAMHVAKAAVDDLIVSSGQ